MHVFAVFTYYTAYTGVVLIPKLDIQANKPMPSEYLKLSLSLQLHYQYIHDGHVYDNLRIIN